MTDAKQNICLAEETAPMTEYTASSPQQFYVLGTHHNIWPTSIWNNQMLFQGVHIECDTFHEKASAQLEFMLLIAAFEKYTENFLFYPAQRKEWPLQATAHPAREGISSRKKSSVHTLRTVLFRQCNFLYLLLWLSL